MNSEYKSLSNSANYKKSDRLTSELNQSEAEEAFNIEWLFSVFFRRLPVMVIVAIALTSIIGFLLIKQAKQTVPIYEGKFKLLIEPASAEGRLTKQFIKAQGSGVDLNKIKIENNSLVDYETQIRVLKSEKLTTEILSQIQTRYPKMNYESLTSKLKIKRITYERDSREYGTKIMQVDYTDKDIEKIQFVLDIVANYYLEYSLEERMISLRNAINFIEKQIPIIQNQVDTIQDEFQAFREKYNIFDPNRQTLQLSIQARTVEDKRLNAELELANAREKYAKLQEQFAQGNFMSILSDQPGYGTLIDQAQKFQSQLAIESGKLREDSIPMQTFREQERQIALLLGKEAQQVLEKTAAKIKILENQKETLATATVQLDREIKQYPLILRRYDELKHQLEVSMGTLKESLSKLEALKLDAAQQEIPWQLIAKPKIVTNKEGEPIPTEINSTKRKLVIVGVLSILLGVGSGFLVEVLIPVFHTSEEVTATTKVPLLGVIPVSKQFKKNTVHKKQKTPVAVLAGVTAKKSNSFLVDNSYPSEMEYSPKLLEAFRYLYTNIRLLTYESALKSLVISSAVYGEGKSTIALNLARIAASVGQRVLLVDANLRNPQIHLRLGLPNLQGFSDTISTDISLNDAIQRSPEDENLFILTAGQVPPDPIKLLSSHKKKYLMEQFNAFFDLIIYDTPPLVDLADTSLITAHVDGTILVVAIEKTDRSMLTKAIEGLKISGASVLGVVTNFHKR